MKPRIHNLPDGLADDVHFLGCEPITAREVARCAGWSDIALYVWQGVINSVQSSRASLCAAIYARLGNHRQNLSACHVASVNALVGFAQKDGSTFIGFGITLLTRHSLCPLIWRMLGPTVGAVITPALPITVASSAFVSQSKRAGRIPQENLWCRLQKLLASIAVSEALFGRNKSLSHGGLDSRYAPICKDGPHWQLPHRTHP